MRIDGRHLLAAAEREEDAADLVKVLDHRAVLNHRVGFADLVDGAGAVQINRTGVDAGVHLQQRHADALEVAVDQGPEAAVSIAVLRTDPGVHDKSPDARDLEDVALEDHLAARDRDVRLQALQERARLFAVRIRDDDARHRAEIGGVLFTQSRHGLRLPGLVRRGEAQPRVGAKGKDVDEVQPADAANLAPCGAAEPSWRITNDDETS